MPRQRDASIGNKLAQLGSRFIDAAAGQIANDFVDRLATRLRERPVNNADQRRRSGLHPLIWVPLLIALVVLILYVFNV
jgi:hypothetical protein